MMKQHRPVTAIIRGIGFNSNGGGFSRLNINGVRYHPDDIAAAVASAPTLAAENAALKALVAEMVNGLEGLVNEAYRGLDEGESRASLFDIKFKVRALIARAKEAL